MKITRRQRDVVALLFAGLTCPEIAERLGIAERTVRRHVEDIDAKMDAEGWPKRHKPIRRITVNAQRLLEAA